MITPYGDLKPGVEYHFDETADDYLLVTVSYAGWTEKRVRWDGVEPEPYVGEGDQLRATIAALESKHEKTLAKLEALTSKMVEKDVLTPKEKEDIEKKEEREAKAAEAVVVSG